MTKYQVLLNILERLRAEAPAEYKRYHPGKDELEKIEQANAGAFIHLFLKARFGLLTFAEREGFITDGSYDGGIDAYYIDSEAKLITFVQSKFRTTENNFEAKDISIKEIFQIEADRISEGHDKSENGMPYNAKINKLIRVIKELPDIGKYRYQIVLLANLRGVSREDLRSICGGFAPVKVFDFEMTYDELVFPIVSGTFFNVSDLFIQLNLADKDFSQSRITYPVKTENASCDITILFVPTLEVARALSRYKNAILKYNPRSYLELSVNSVNREIAATIRGKSTNEFSLFNNGITMLSDETNLNEKIGQKNKGVLFVKNPQIINGGQTAFTLSRIFEDYLKQGVAPEAFEGKEVMLKVITFPTEAAEESKHRMQLIEQISKATNQQSPVTEADRRSNDEIQIVLQRLLFKEFGFFYERKRGEFADGLHAQYINRSLLIDREQLARIALSGKGRPSDARKLGANRIFDQRNYSELFGKDVDGRRLMFGLFALDRVGQLLRAAVADDPYRTREFGSALRYGRYAVIAAALRRYKAGMVPVGLRDEANMSVDSVLSKWSAFEAHAMAQPDNTSYFLTYIDPATKEATRTVDFDNYYKGRNVNRDIAAFEFA